MDERYLVEVVVEIPQGSQNKYEIDHNTGRLRLDRVLYSPFHYPVDYGFAEHTLGEDGDPLDIMVLISQPTVPGCLVRGRIVGLLEMADENGIDHKVLTVAADDPRYDHIENLNDVSPHILKEIAHFFATYKELQGVQTQIGDWRDRDEGRRILDQAIARYQAG